MFPRRRTDQVYATLQQVQRRITEQSGVPQSAATPAGMLPTVGRAPSIGTPTLTPGPQPALRTGPQIPADQPPPLLPPGVAAHQRYAVVLSGTLATLLAVCWLASVAVTILITWQVTRPPVSMSGEPLRMSSSAGAAPMVTRYKLVVRSEPRPTPEVRQALARERDKLNGIMQRNAERGWLPLFEVEEGVNGAISLVFARQGADRVQWQDFFSKLSSQREYAGATWVEVR